MRILLPLLCLLLPACHCGSDPDTAGGEPATMTVLENSEGPWISITSPTSYNSWAASSDTLLVEGLAAETATGVGWSSSAGSSGEVQGTTEWSLTLALVEGWQDYSFTATDSAGRTSSVQLRVLYQGGEVLGRPWLSTPVGRPGEAVDVGLETALEADSAQALFTCDGDDWTVSLGQDEPGAWGAGFTVGDQETTCAVRVDLVLGGATLQSLPRVFKVRAPVTEERAEELLELHDALYSTVLEQRDDMQAAFAAVQAALEQRDDIAGTGWDDHGIWWLSSDDLLFHITLVTDAQLAESASTISGGAPPPPFAPLPSYGYPSSLGEADTPDRLFRLWDLYFTMESYQPQLTEVLAAQQDDGGECGMQFEWLPGPAADVDNLLELDSSVNIIASHGAIIGRGSCSEMVDASSIPYWWPCGEGQGPHAFLTYEEVTPSFVVDWQDDIQAYNLIVDKAVFKEGVAADPDESPWIKYAGVLPGFFDWNFGPEAFDRAVFLMFVCFSAENGSMGEVILDHGASAYMGFTGPSFTAYDDDFYVGLIQAWTDGDSLSEAYEQGMAAVDNLDSAAWWLSFGGDEADAGGAYWPRVFARHEVPSLQGDLVRNGGFEEGVDPWILGGTAEISHGVYGYVTEWGDDTLHLELDPGASQAFAYGTQHLQQSTLEAGSYTLGFQYRLATEYSNMDCSSSDPWFVVRVDPGGWSDTPSGGDIQLRIDPSDFCDDLVNDGWVFVGDWTQASVGIELAEDVDEAFLTFMAGTSYWEEHHVLVDQVELMPGDCGE